MTSLETNWEKNLKIIDIINLMNKNEIMYRNKKIIITVDCLLIEVHIYNLQLSIYTLHKIYF